MHYLKSFLVLMSSFFVALFLAFALVNQRYLGEISSLQGEIAARDNKITALEKELVAKQEALFVLPKAIVDVPGVTVAQVQKALQGHGFYNGPADGKINRQTVDAVKKFQKASGLKADGMIGKRTWSLLKNEKQSSMRSESDNQHA